MKFYDKIIGIDTNGDDTFELSFVHNSLSDYFSLNKALSIAGTLYSSGTITSGANFTTTSGNFTTTSGRFNIGNTTLSSSALSNATNFWIQSGQVILDAINISFRPDGYENAWFEQGVFYTTEVVNSGNFSSNNVFIDSLTPYNLPYIGAYGRISEITLPTTGTGKEDLFYVLAKKTNSSGALVDTPE